MARQSELSGVIDIAGVLDTGKLCFADVLDPVSNFSAVLLTPVKHSKTS
jgi:hypothetical protein